MPVYVALYLVAVRFGPVIALPVMMRLTSNGMRLGPIDSSGYRIQAFDGLYVARNSAMKQEWQLAAQFLGQL